MGGIVGIVDSSGAAYPLYYALHALQHRGQDAAGMSIFQDGILLTYKGPGQITKIFNEQILSKFSGVMGIGQVFKQKVNCDKLDSIQPLKFSFRNHELSIAVSAALVRNRSESLHRECEEGGYIFSTTTDAELIAAMIIHEIIRGKDAESAFANTIQQIEGAYSCVAILDGVLYAFRDPLGTKPLCLGKLDTGYIVASESVSIDSLSGTFLRDVIPGELIIITSHNGNSDLSSRQILIADHKAYCAFEYIHTARPDSVIDGVLVYDARRRIGEQLAKYQVKADLVSPIPDSGTAFAIGFADASGIPYIEALMKNRYAGRSESAIRVRRLRDNEVKVELNPVRRYVNGKSIILVNDSIVPIATLLKIVDLLREFGATEVHVRIGSTLGTSLCHSGVDLQIKGTMNVNIRSVEICKLIHATSLEYITNDDLVKSIGISLKDLCMACSRGTHFGTSNIPYYCHACNRVV